MSSTHPSFTQHSGTQPLRPLPVDLDVLENQILPRVFKPGRYLGIEQGAFNKPFDKAAVTMGWVFPELYEIGISNYAHKLFYSLVNNHQDYVCDRIYAPAPDFKEKLAEFNMPLYGVESKVALKDFDLAAFSLQYELNYTTVLGVLEAAQIPFRSVDRPTLDYPILIAGGPGSGNPMPTAPFFDAFIIGDGEEILIEILDTLKEGKKKGWDKSEMMAALAKLEGMFIPGLTLKAHKRIIDIAQTDIELAPLIPTVGAVHDRVTIEARRGCDRMCRFCQPCFINLPVREQSIEKIKDSALKEIEKTGYEECSLLSLSIADYSYLKPLINEVAGALKEKNVSLSLPSQRADRFNLEVAEAVQSVRKSTLTFAPEAGTARLRDVINKNLTDAEIMNAVTTAYQAGWNKVKLYFIIGLPTETHADLDGIVDTVQRMKGLCAAIKRDPGKSIRSHLEVNLTLSNFVPKPHTPFQWFPQETMASLREKIQYLRDRFRNVSGVKINYTDPEISKLEAVISKGGPELADVLELAYRKGAYLDAWDDVQNFEKWFSAMTEKGIDVEAYTRDRLSDLEEPLPWDPIDVGLEKTWLQEEYRRALEAASTTPCFDACSTCGVCANYSTWPKFIELPKGKPVLKVQKPEVPRQMKLPPVSRVRLKIQKRGPLRFMSHLDWLRMIHRAVTRAKLPVAFSQGFNPSLKISFGPALPLMTEGYKEYLELDLTEPISGITEKMNPYLPEDGKILEEQAVQLYGPSIEECIRSLSYSARWTCKDPEKEYTIINRVKFLANQTQLPVEVEPKKSRTTKTEAPKNKVIIDLAPYLSDLRIENNTVCFTVKRAIGETGQPVTIKPAWVLNLIDPENAMVQHWSIARTDIELAQQNQPKVLEPHQ